MWDKEVSTSNIKKVGKVKNMLYVLRTKPHDCLKIKDTPKWWGSPTWKASFDVMYPSKFVV